MSFNEPFRASQSRTILIITRGPTVLVLLFDGSGQPIHVVWGLEKGTREPAVLVTTYRPTLDKWEADFRTRKR
jgi:hypothetical protein